MSKKINFFNRHLKEIEESFFEHFAFSFSTAMWLFVTGFILLVHAFFPFIFVMSSSRHIKNINEVMQKRVSILPECKHSHKDENQS